MSTHRSDDDWDPSTRCLWGGEPAHLPEGVTVMPVFHGVTFAYDSFQEWPRWGAATGGARGAGR